MTCHIVFRAELRHGECRTNIREDEVTISTQTATFQENTNISSKNSISILYQTYAILQLSYLGLISNFIFGMLIYSIVSIHLRPRVFSFTRAHLQSISKVSCKPTMKSSILFVLAALTVGITGGIVLSKLFAGELEIIIIDWYVIFYYFL